MSQPRPKETSGMEEEDEATDSNFCVLRARPKLGMGRTVYFKGIRRSDAVVNDATTQLPQNLVHLEQQRQ